jgi:hypothetical protein
MFSIQMLLWHKKKAGVYQKAPTVERRQNCHAVVGERPAARRDGHSMNMPPFT